VLGMGAHTSYITYMYNSLKYDSISDTLLEKKPKKIFKQEMKINTNNLQFLQEENSKLS
jgi:hypothetical protein